MLRIALLGEHDPAAAEGMAAVARELSPALEKAGARVFDFVAPRNPRLQALDPRTLRALRRARPDIAIYIPRSGLTQATTARCRLLQMALPSSRLRTLILQAPDESLAGASQATAYLVPSRRLEQRFRRSRLATSFVPVGIDEQRFNQGEAPQPSRVWASPRSRPRVLHVGHLKRSRNVEALATLSAAGYDCALVASPSTAPDGALWEALTAAGVRVVRERIDDLPNVFRQADVYVFPVVDPRGCIEVPLSALEAYACGTRIVTTRFGAMPELFQGVSGVTFADVDELPTAVASALSGPAPDGLSPVQAWDDAGPQWIDTLEQSVGAPRSVLVTGLDGTGKSTQVARIVEEASRRGIPTALVWARWDPVVLAPLMRSIRGSNAARSAGESDAHLRRKQRIFRSSVVRHLWRAAAAGDYVIGVAPRLFRAFVRSELVVLDRYYDDALVDMGANFGSVPPQTPRLLARVLPTPERSILLDMDVEAIVERAPDAASGEYLRRRRPLYKEVARRGGWSVVDAAGSVDQVARSIASIVWAGK